MLLVKEVKVVNSAHEEYQISSRAPLAPVFKEPERQRFLFSQAGKTQLFDP